MPNTVTVSCGDTDFQKTLTEKERAFIHDGCNWLSKLSRESTLKSLHALGYTLDEIEALPEEEAKAIRSEANRCWNIQDWSDAKYKKAPASVPGQGKIIVRSDNRR